MTKWREIRSSKSETRNGRDLALNPQLLALNSSSFPLATEHRPLFVLNP